MEKLNKQMDDALNTKVAALNATDDEAIVLIFRNINANRNHHNKYLQR